MAKGTKEITNEQQNSQWGQHRHCPKVDTVIGCFVMGAFLFGIFHKLIGEVSENLTEWNPYTTSLITMSVIGALIDFAMFFLWFTLCFNLKIIHGFWNYRTEFSPALMPGGFAPRYGAFLLGVILFVSSTSTSEAIQPGYMLKLGFVWRPGPYCRATFVSMAPTASNFWKRFDRVEATGCYKAPSETTGGAFNLVTFLDPASVEMGQMFNNTWGKTLPANLIHPDPKIAGKERESGYCYYQCFTWTEIAFHDLVGNLGMIFAGAAVVVKITDSASASLGWTMVTEDTSVETLTHLREVSSNFGWAPGPFKHMAEGCCEIFHKSRAFCALQLLLINLAARWSAAIFGVDGFNTIDYYVSMVIFQSVFFAVVLRSWNPFTNAPVIYTRKLWMEGTDQFIDLDVDPPVFRDINLYEWLHLTTKQRLTHAALYARRVGLDAAQSTSGDEDIDDIGVGKRKWEEKSDLFYAVFDSIRQCYRTVVSCGGFHHAEEGPVEDLNVVALKPYQAPKDVELIFQGEKVIETEMVNVPISTSGKITGTTGDGNFLVDWDIKGEKVSLPIEPLFVAQVTSDWTKFMRDSHLISLRKALVD